MEGYLQALIDRYHKLYMASVDMEKQTIYGNILSDLRDMERYMNTTKDAKENSMESLETAGKKKKIAMIFTGKSSDLTEFLKEKMRGAD